MAISTSIGNMARPYSSLSILGQADLLMLQASVTEARMRATEADDRTTGANLFAATIDPALVEIVNKYHQQIQMSNARVHLRNIFGPTWQSLSNDCCDFLTTAEVVKDQLMSYSENEAAIDFTPAVQMYSVALEKELLEKLFVAFRNSDLATELPSLTGKNSLRGRLNTEFRYVLSCS
jgi:hypothetical protein